MKRLRFLLLSMVICLASGVKAQFYDSADDICYYKQICEYDEETGKIKKFEKDDSNGDVQVWNFDGRKAARLEFCSLSLVKESIKRSSSYYEDLVETSEYDWTYTSVSPYIRECKSKKTWLASYLPGYGTMYEHNGFPVIFSSDRNKMYMVCESVRKGDYFILEYKKVDKSFFRVGRSRTPSSTMHE